jgi:hypothetical protein
VPLALQSKPATKAFVPTPSSTPTPSFLGKQIYTYTTHHTKLKKKNITHSSLRPTKLTPTSSNPISTHSIQHTYIKMNILLITNNGTPSMN